MTKEKFKPLSYIQSAANANTILYLSSEPIYPRCNWKHRLTRHDRNAKWWLLADERNRVTVSRRIQKSNKGNRDTDDATSERCPLDSLKRLHKLLSLSRFIDRCTLLPWPIRFTWDFNDVSLSLSLVALVSYPPRVYPLSPRAYLFLSRVGGISIGVRHLDFTRSIMQLFQMG